MTGHSDDVTSKILWPDAEIESILIDFGELVITLTESSGQKTTVRCKGYIGYSAVGFWDEIVVQSAELLVTDDFIEECLDRLRQRYGNELPDSGDSFRNQRSYRTLAIHLIDGASLKVVAAAFAVA